MKNNKTFKRILIAALTLILVISASAVVALASDTTSITPASYTKKLTAKWEEDATTDYKFIGSGGDDRMGYIYASIQISAVKQRLQLLKGKHCIDVRLDLLELCLGLFGRTRANENDLGVGGGVLDILGQNSHGRGVVRDQILELREGRLDIANKGRTAGAGQKALLCKLTRLSQRDHISTQCRLDNGVEAQSLQTRNDLTELGIGELAGDRGGDQRVNAVIAAARITLTLFENINGVDHKRLVHDGAEGTLIHTGTALDALIVVDLGRLFLVHGDGFHLAGVLAGTLAADDSRVGAHLGTSTALLALGLVDVRHVVLVKGQSAELADVLATVRQAPAAGVGNLVAADGTFVAGDIDDLYDVGVVGVTAHGDLDALSDDGALLIDTAAHGYNNCKIG